MLAATVADQAQVGLVDEGRGLERLPRRFMSQLVRRQPAQFLVDQRQELRGGLRVARVDGIQHHRDVGHETISGGSRQCSHCKWLRFAC
jgi:hypothetical protein